MKHLCPCGCGEWVTSKKAVYFSPACRIKAFRQRNQNNPKNKEISVTRPKYEEIMQDFHSLF